MIYRFRPKNYPIFTLTTVEEILQKHTKGGSCTVTLDMGRTSSKIFFINDLICTNAFKIPICKLKDIKWREGDIYCYNGECFLKIAFFGDGKYYRLREVRFNTAPTLEISGIHMHRIKNITPWEDSLMKIKLAKIRRGHKVLDICTGLGYTAILAMLRGAISVTTIERDINVLKIAEYNPWSRELADERIKIVVSRAEEYLPKLPSNHFDRIVHDPPRMALAGELYSKRFYTETYRVLKPGGIMVHYTGQPGYLSGKNIIAGVCRRLKEVGFKVKIVKELPGVVCYKPNINT